MVNSSIIFNDNKFSTSPHAYMMRVTAIKLLNFKAFVDSGWIELNRLVLLIGRNSIGKSSITQALRMIMICCEKLQQGRIQPGLLSLEDQFGSFEDIRNHGSDGADFTIILKLVGDTGEYQYTVKVSKDDYQTHVRISLNNATAEIYAEDDQNEIENIFFARVKEKKDSVMSNALFLSAVKAVREFASNLEYIDPVRSVPRRQFEVSGTMANTVGIRGDNAYDMLYYLSQIEQDMPEPVVTWLDKFGYELIWKAQDNRKNVGGFWLRNTRTGDMTNIVDNGFGISQSLPIVLAMALKQKGVLVIDTPEAHLQAPIESSFTDIIRMSIRDELSLMLETGSEQILMRVRKYITDGTIDSNNVSCYFVDETDGDNRVKCTELHILPTGVMGIDGSGFSEFFSDVAEDMMEIKKMQLKQMKKNADEKNSN